MNSIWPFSHELQIVRSMINALGGKMCSVHIPSFVWALPVAVEQRFRKYQLYLSLQTSR